MKLRGRVNGKDKRVQVGKEIMEQGKEKTLSQKGKEDINKNKTQVVVAEKTRGVHEHSTSR